MTPLDFARKLAASDKLEDRALGVGIVARGLSDEDPSDPTRAGWPLAAAINAAIGYLELPSTPDLIKRATELAPTISDAMLNRSAR